MYPAVYQVTQTFYTIMAPIIIIITLKCMFCCGRTRLKPGQTQEEVLLDYVHKKLKTKETK